MRKKLEALVPSLSGFQYGYNTSIIAGALLFITRSFSLAPYQQGLTVAILFISTCLACFSGTLANNIGLKRTLLIGAFFFLLGNILSFEASSFYMLLASRFLIGFGAGIGITVAPLYLIEIAPIVDRGKVVNMNQIAIGLGTLIAYATNYFLSFTENWRLMFGLGVLPAALQIIGFFFIKEIKLQKKDLKKSSWKEVFTSKNTPKIWLTILLTFFQAFTAIMLVSFYAPTIFENAGFANVTKSLLATMAIGVVYLIALSLSTWAVDRFGRRALMFTSFIGMFLSLFTIAFFSFKGVPYLSVISLIGVLVYFFSYALGAGPLTPLIVSEIAPVNIRGHLVALMGILGWILNSFISFTFPVFLGKTSLAVIFTFYGFCCLVGLIVFYKKLPETKQKSLRQIDKFFRKKNRFLAFFSRTK